MASLRIFAGLKLSSFLQGCRKTELQRLASPAVLEIQKKWSSFRSSPEYKDPSKYTDFEITSDPKEWKYVEQILPYKVVPQPPATGVSATGWKPPNVDNKNLPYYLPRSRNHMQPVYMNLSKRGMRKLTYIRKIQGDIWKFESDLKQHLEANKNRSIGSRISELAGVVIFRGDHVKATKEWLDMKGF